MVCGVGGTAAGEVECSKPASKYVAVAMLCYAMLSLNAMDGLAGWLADDDEIPGGRGGESWTWEP